MDCNIGVAIFLNDIQTSADDRSAVLVEFVIILRHGNYLNLE